MTEGRKKGLGPGIFSFHPVRLLHSFLTLFLPLSLYHSYFYFFIKKVIPISGPCDKFKSPQLEA